MHEGISFCYKAGVFCVCIEKAYAHMPAPVPAHVPASVPNLLARARARARARVRACLDMCAQIRVIGCERKGE